MLTFKGFFLFQTNVTIKITMDILHAFIFGIVEGITEFLPISSTGHLMLTSYLLNEGQSSFLKSFEIMIQFGAILSVVVLYWKDFLFNREILKRIGVAFIPTAILGLIFYKTIKTVLLGNNQVVLWALFIGGVCLIIFELIHKEKENVVDDLSKISYRQSFAVGLFQSIAMIPGVSRSAATILGGLLMGLKRKTIVEFSFLLAVPTMLAATFLDTVKNINVFALDQVPFLLVGFITSFLVALGSIKFLLSFVKHNTFSVFGVYRIVIAVLFWFLIL